jgi:hypothetical protein
MGKEVGNLKFTALCLETFAALESREARLNTRGRKLLAWLRRRYPVRETFRIDDKTMVTKIPIHPAAF